jgi:hypothetical protein
MKTKNILAVILITLFSTISGGVLRAYDFSYTYQGKTLYYDTTSSNTVQVSNYSYSDLDEDIIIPPQVTYNNTIYSVTSIGKSAFYHCSSLRNVTIPSSVTTLGYWTFHNCSSLNSIDIPSSVTYIDKGSFAGCSDIDTIYSRNPYPPTIENESTFDDISRDNTTIFVPKGSIEAYKKAVIWDQFSNIQEY